MKQALSIIITFLIFTSVKAQTHTIQIHPNERVASLEMDSTEYSNWIANNNFNNNVVREALIKDIYQKFDDNFDFIFFVLNEDVKPSNLAYGQLIQVSNNISGIGLGPFDYTSNYGSAGKLKSVLHLTRRDYIRLGPSLHELTHNWANFGIQTESVNNFGNNLTSYGFKPHWGFTGGSSKGQLGGFDKTTLVDNGGGSYTVPDFGPHANGGNSVPYNELELYLMGMIPASDVSDFDVFTNITSFIDNGNSTYTFNAGTRKTYTSTILTNELGDRIPSSTTSQKDFRALVIVLTDNPLTTEEWNLVDNHAELFSRNSSDNSSIYNFWEATNGLGTIEMGNLKAYTKNKNTYAVSFNVAYNSNAIANANISFNGADYTTDANGQVIINNVENGTYSYSVTAAGYDDITSSITVSGTAVSETINLSASKYNVAFTVLDKTGPIANANIAFNGTNYTTDESGKLAVSNMTNGSYSFTVTSINHEVFSGSLSVSNKDVFKIILLSTSTATKPVSARGIKIYPNPSNGIFNIEYEGNATIYIYNFLGKLIMKKEMTDNTQISLYENGVFYITLISPKDYFTKKILIKN